MERGWIANPAEHRRVERSIPVEAIDGMFGGAKVIVLPYPPDDEWFCDVCNAQILTRWGDEPFPVPVDGSYALCGDCYERAGGRWPIRGCVCEGCLPTIKQWKTFLTRLLDG